MAPQSVSHSTPKTTPASGVPAIAGVIRDMAPDEFCRALLAAQQSDPDTRSVTYDPDTQTCTAVANHDPASHVPELRTQCLLGKTLTDQSPASQCYTATVSDDKATVTSTMTLTEQCRHDAAVWAACATKK